MILTTKVIGKPEPEVKWFRDTIELKPSYKTKITRVDEVSTLTISGVTKQMSGTYRTVATNKFGQAEHSATITICEKLEPAKFTLRPMNKEVKEDQPVKFGVRAKGLPSPEITVYKDEQPLDDNRIKVETKEVDKEVHVGLTIESVKPEDATVFKFVAKNPAGEDECTATLRVIGEFQINEHR